MYPQNSKILKIIMKRHPPGCCHTSTLLRCLPPPPSHNNGFRLGGTHHGFILQTILAHRVVMPSLVTFSDCTGSTSPELDLETKSPELDLGTKS